MIWAPGAGRYSTSMYGNVPVCVNPWGIAKLALSRAPTSVEGGWPPVACGLNGPTTCAMTFTTANVKVPARLLGELLRESPQTLGVIVTV